MTPIFKNAEIKFEDIGEYMQNYHTENNIKFNQGKNSQGHILEKKQYYILPFLSGIFKKG